MAQPVTTSERVDGKGRTLWLIGPLAIIAAIIANLIARFIAFALLPLSDAVFVPLQIGAIIVFTVAGVGSAVIVYALVKRFAKNPVRTYLIIAAIALIISCIPNAQMIMDPSAAPFPGGTVEGAWLLFLFHPIAAIVGVGILVTLGGPVKK